VTFDEWIGARGGALLRFALMLSADAGRAEDLVQSVLVHVYPRWPRISAMVSPEAYVKASIVNEHLKWWRRLSNRELPVEALVDRPGDGDFAAQQASRDAAWALLGRLPRRQRAVLALRYYEDMSDDAIAAVMGCSVSTVRSQAARALATLRATVPTMREESMP
jgi:RNA polymerase sigma-70 factor (sigma-E family)